MRNKDVLKKLKNLPDNTKEYIDNKDFIKVITDFEILTNGKIAKIYTDSLEVGNRYRFDFKNNPGITSAVIVKKYDDDTTKTITTITKSNNYVYVSAMYKSFELYFNNVIGSLYKISGSFGTTSSEYTSEILKLVLDTQSDRLFIPTKDYHPATKKYVDDNVSNIPLKKITSTEESPIIISELSDGIYDFGTTSFVKMFSSDTEILKKVLGICVLYSVSNVKKILFVNFKSNIAIFNVEDRYALDIENKTYTMLQFTKLVRIGGSSNTPVILLDEITENGGYSFGLYQTTCSTLKLTAESKAVNLDSGSKILLITSSTTKGITTYKINSFGAFSIKKIQYEYNTNTKDATLISEDSVVFNKELEDTKYNLQKVTNYINDIYDNRFTVLDTNIENTTYVNNDTTNGANITRYFNIDKTLDDITDFDTCFINLKYYVYGILRTYSFNTTINKSFNYFSVIANTVDCEFMAKLVIDKQINENLEEIDAAGKCYFYIKYARGTEDYAITAIDSGNIEVQLSSNKILKIDNSYEYTPTSDYNPATKKYVDDTADTLVQKDTNKYILICNDDTLVINKTNITDLTDTTITIDNLTGQFGNLVANDDGTYSYTLNTIMTDVETFTFKVNDVEQKLVIVPYREMIYDDNNAGITYDDKWTTEEDSKHYKGSAHKIENQIGTSTIIFKGTGIDVYTKIAPICGTSTIDIYNGIGSKKEDGKYKPALYTKYIDNNSDNIYYKQPSISAKKLNFNTYTSEIMGGMSNSTYYLDYIVIYDTLGTNLNDSIRKLYYKLDNSIGVLRTDIENYAFNPTRLYDPTTKKYVDEKVAGIVDSAPETLDTLKELSTALGNDPNFATTVATNIGNKVDKVDGKGLSTNDLTDELKTNYDAAYAYSQATHSYNDLTDKPEIPSIDGLATTEYVDSKALPIILIDDTNRTGDKLFPLLPEHNLVFIAGDAHLTDSSNNTVTVYGLCYSDLQSDGSKLITEYRTTKSAKLSSAGVLESFEYIDEYTNTVMKELKNGYNKYVLSADDDGNLQWVRNIQPSEVFSYKTFEVLEGYTYGTADKYGNRYCADVELPFEYYKNWTSNYSDFFYAMGDYGAKFLFTFADGTTKEAPVMTYNRLYGEENPIPDFMVDYNQCTDETINTFTIEFFGKGTGAPVENGCSIINLPDNCTSIKITIPEPPASKTYVDSKIPYVLLSDMITISDSKVNLELNNFEKDKTYIIINDYTANKDVYHSDPVTLLYNGETITTIVLTGYFPYITLGIRSSENKAYISTLKSFYTIDITNKTREIVDGYSLSKMALASSVLTKTNTTEYTPTKDYHPATKKYVDDAKDSIVVPTKVSELTNDSGFLTEHQSLADYAKTEYVDSKTSIENVIYDGDGTGDDVVSDYWTHCSVNEGLGCWVIDKSIDFDFTKPNPYYLLCDNTLYSPKNSKADTTNNAWIYDDHNEIFICNTYNNFNKLILPWDGAGSPQRMKLFTRTEITEIIGNLEASDEEISNMLVEVLGGDYSVNS